MGENCIHGTVGEKSEIGRELERIIIRNKVLKKKERRRRPPLNPDLPLTTPTTLTGNESIEPGQKQRSAFAAKVLLCWSLSCFEEVSPSSRVSDFLSALPAADSCYLWSLFSTQERPANRCIAGDTPCGILMPCLLSRLPKSRGTSLRSAPDITRLLASKTLRSLVCCSQSRMCRFQVCQIAKPRLLILDNV